MQYESRSEIENCKQLSKSTDGFEMYRVKWAIGKLPPPPRPQVYKTLKLEMGTFCLLVRSKGDKLQIFLDLWKSVFFEPRMSVMARATLSSKSAKFSSSGTSFYFGPACGDYGAVWDFHMEQSKRAADDFVVCCWIDVSNNQTPKSIAVESIPSNSGPWLLLSVIAELFDQVINANENSTGTSDVVLVTWRADGVEQRFYCHRNILCGRSPVFSTMLANDNFVEGARRTVEIDDIQSDTIEHLLRYVYTGKYVKIGSKQELVELMNAAEKYVLPELMEECAYEYVRSLTEDTDRIDLLRLADMFRLDWIKPLCVMALTTRLSTLSTVGQISEELKSEWLKMYDKRDRDTKFIDVGNE